MSIDLIGNSLKHDEEAFEEMKNMLKSLTIQVIVLLNKKTLIIETNH